MVKSRSAPASAALALLVTLSCLGCTSSEDPTGSNELQTPDEPDSAEAEGTQSATTQQQPSSPGLPPVLTSLPTEHEGSYDQPELVGLRHDDVEEWAQQSGLVMIVFDSIDAINVDAVFVQNRLVVVVEDGIITYSRIG
jgi:hypothetical protein